MNGKPDSMAWQIASDEDGGNAIAMILENHPVDFQRPLQVICVGAGISGIYGASKCKAQSWLLVDALAPSAAMRFPHSLPNVSLKLYEKNAE